MVEKSFDLRVAECKMDMVDVLNRSALPISVLTMIVREINETVVNQNAVTLQKAKSDYEEALKQEQEKEVANQENEGTNA